jgi:ParB-like chromosome segregation protein Spo0J
MSQADYQIQELVPHPVNREIYGPLDQREVEDLKESIREYGLQKPLVVRPNPEEGTFTIIAGHRRFQAMKELGFSHVPATISETDNEAGEVIEIILDNQYRQKTNEQRIREGIALEEAEKQKAKARQAGEDTGERGAVRDLIAARIGMSGKTFEKGKKVVQEMDEIEDEEAKDEVRAKLNKSVSSAAQKAEEEPEPPAGYPAYWKDLKKAINSLEYTYHKLAKLRSHATSDEFNHFVGNLMDMANRLRTWDPDVVKQNGPGAYKESQY